MSITWEYPCPACTQPVDNDDRFCEWCGVRLPRSGDSCQCGAAVGGGRGPEGRCPSCGTANPAPEPGKPHSSIDLAYWLGGCCDLGRRHRHNDDVLTLAILDDPARAALVVCDGVSSAPRSAEAAAAAATAAISRLRNDPSDRLDAVSAANEAAAAVGSEGEAAACTVALAVLSATSIGGRLASATVGDSRVYWLPDDLNQEAQRLGDDDSVAGARVAIGVPQAEAEAAPGAHAITAWLGSDAPPLHPHLHTLDLETAGWVLVCSDGLWNYFSAAEDLRAELHRITDDLLDGTRPEIAGDDVQVRAAQVARELVAAANAAGGSDNISVALARWDGDR